ncbi:MAG TPA: cation-translocating P-type ATPase C-terminal domain-containing protein, partial [bacterium]|nr:cation-translocating P-type ATPase C-terminal domain-containing protein [bacterium]
VGLLAFLNGDDHWQTLLFTTLIFSQAALALSVRSDTRPLWKIGLLSNRSMLGAILLTVVLQLAVVYQAFLQGIFGTTAMPPTDLLIAVLSAAIVLVAAEGWKWAARRWGS